MIVPLALTLAAFAVAVFFIIRPTTIKLFGRKLVIDYAWGSIIGAAIILIGSAVSPGQALNSLVGRPGFSPYTMIIFFMCMAYVSISLDSTGFFEYLAVKMIMRTGGDRKRLFLYFFALSSFITLFTSNDIVILTLTPIIFYFGKHAKINAVPYLVAEFFAANIWSMFLYIGNPTNIIVAMANNVNFFEYSQWMLLPTVVAGLLNLGIMYLIFRDDVSGKFTIPREINPREFIRDKVCAWVTLIVFAANIVMIAISPLIGIEMWVVALVFTGILFLYDFAMAFIESSSERMLFYRVFKRYVYAKDTKTYRFRLHLIAERMPWKIIPFLACVFVMIESLSVIGFTDLLAAFISLISPTIMTASISMGFVSSLAANVINNQPMTVLFTRVMESPSFTVAGPARLASMYSLIIGSNLGANLTLIGALAGIMWAKILKSKNVGVSYAKFAMLGFIITPLVILAACAVLGLEFMLFG